HSKPPPSSPPRPAGCRNRTVTAAAVHTASRLCPDDRQRALPVVDLVPVPPSAPKERSAARPAQDHDMCDNDAEDQHTLTATTSRRHRQTAQDAQKCAIGTPSHWWCQLLTRARNRQGAAPRSDSVTPAIVHTGSTCATSPGSPGPPGSLGS